MLSSLGWLIFPAISVVESVRFELCIELYTFDSHVFCRFPQRFPRLFTAPRSKPTTKGICDMDTNVQLIWEQTLKLLEEEMPRLAFVTWVKRLAPYQIHGDAFILIAEDSDMKQTLDKKHAETIKKALFQVSGEQYTPVFLLQANLDAGDFSQKTQKSIYRATLRSKYVFENFVKGKSNEFAFTASHAVAEAPGQSYNPLFLYGGVGLGKTHLMHSIGNYILETSPDAKVLYTSAENLTNEFISSIKSNKNKEFRDKYRTIDVLLIDDIQFLSEKEGTQEEFFHTFNELHISNKQIVISSDKPPNELKSLTSRLTSRFGSGLIVDITLPDFETRMAILEKKAELEHLNLRKDVMMMIARNISSNIRELEGALNKVTAYAKLTKTEITLELAERALRDMISGSAKREVSVEFIQEVVANHYGIMPEELRSKKRTAHITQARHMAMYLSRKLLDGPLTKIGQAFGGRDHTTVIHACDKISAEVESNEETRKTVGALEKAIRGDN